MENLNGHGTFLQYANAVRIPIGTLQKRYVREFGTGFDKHAIPTSEQYLALFGGQTPVEKKVRTTDAQTADNVQADVVNIKADAVAPIQTSKRSDWIGMLFRSVCALIVLSHAVLIAYDCWILWGVPGGMAGLIALLTVIACLILSSDERQKELSGQMIWFVWLIDAAAAFVHYPTFWNKAGVGYAMGVRQFETACLAFFVCLCSMAASYFFWASKLKKDEK